MKNLIACFLLVGIIAEIWAAPGSTTYHIKVDQFGYLPTSKKVAVIADPQVGNNAAESFNPGSGANQYQVRRWDNDAIVFSGTISQWKSGVTHIQSGDRGWWFDFTAVNTPGSYYIYDVANNIGSFRFEINDAVYDEVLKQAVRTFYYQRINFAKQIPFTESKWSDGACFSGPNQDYAARSRWAKTDAATARDVHGGWMDAGDKNKYTTFAMSAVIQMLEAYRINPAVFKDNYNIPESGNGIPDILDEVMYELDFLKRMQDATGTNGLFLKVGTDNYNEVNPPSADTRPRYYLPECTSATISGAAMFAVAASVLSTVPALNVYAQNLITRAETAWARAKVTTTNFTTFELNCDDGDIKSGDADADAAEQFDRAFVAASYLYALTNKAEYKTFAESNYTNVNPYKINWWGPYWIPQQLALLRLAATPGVSSSVATNIRNQKASMNYLFSINDYTNATDLYRSHIADDQYHWGHNQVHTNVGSQNLDFVTFNLNASSHALYKEVAEQYLHWMHGTNPLGMVMLSNMYSLGAEKSANEIYHTWFTDGSNWDNALTSLYGPVPGYVTGGPNKNYSGSATNITNQPPQKAYKDWNNVAEASWEITEPAIYSQASYIMLLSRLMPATTTPGDTVKPTAPLNLTITNTTNQSISLSWNASSDNMGVTGYLLYQNGILINNNIVTTNHTVTGLVCNTNHSFYVKAKDAAGNTSDQSNTVNGTTAPCTILVNKIIYDDILHAEWTNVSNTTINMNNTSPVRAGTKSINVNFTANSSLAFSKTLAAPTSSTTQLRFWVYNSGTNSIRIFTQSQDNGGTSTVITTKPARRKWTEVIINLSQLGNPASIKRVVIQNANTSNTTMFFDEIRLTNIVETPSSLVKPSLPLAVFSQPTVVIEVYPNPASNIINTKILSYKSQLAEIQIIDQNGKLVTSKKLLVNSGFTTEELAVDHLTQGIYYLKLVNNSQQITKKIEILR